MKIGLAFDDANDLGLDLMTRMLLFGRKTNVGNPICFFASVLGYKSSTILYKKLHDGNIGQMKVVDVLTIEAILEGKKEGEIKKEVERKMEELSRGLVYG